MTIHKSEKDYYFFTIEKKSVAEYKDRGSRFLAYAFPVSSAEDFKKHYRKLKEEHPKAVHHCYAYRLGTEGNSFRSSDDGEPSGTAGRPILGQIDSRQLTNTALVVIRYFGGTLLGIPGLIQAYKTAAALALQITPVVKKPLRVRNRLQFDYTIINDVMRIIKKYDCEIFHQEMNLFCTLEIGIPKAVLELCTSQLLNLKGIEILMK